MAGSSTTPSGRDTVVSLVAEAVSAWENGSVIAPEAAEAWLVEPTRSVLIHGPSGVGKTAACVAAAAAADVDLRSLSVLDLCADFPGSRVRGLRRFFNESAAAVAAGVEGRKRAVVVLLDDIDGLAPRFDADGAGRADDGGAVSGETKVASELAALLRALEPRSGVVVMATTRNLRLVDSRVASAFDDTIAFQIPNATERSSGLRLLLEGALPAPPRPETDLTPLAHACHGFTYADLAQLVGHLIEAGALDDVVDPGHAAVADVLQKVRAAMLVSHVSAEVPDVRWDDVGGLDGAKAHLQDAVVWMFGHADAVRARGLSPASGVLLFGPPGTGKTLLAKAVATEAAANFIAVEPADVLSAHVGGAEGALAAIFATAVAAEPCVVFFDEVQALFAGRSASGATAFSRTLAAQFVLELDGLRASGAAVAVVAATNMPHRLDEALLSPGRFDVRVFVSVPDTAARADILRVLASEIPLGDDVDLSVLAERTRNYTGADLRAVLQTAGLAALAADTEAATIGAAHIDHALGRVKASVSFAMLNDLAAFAEGGGGGAGPSSA